MLKVNRVVIPFAPILRIARSGALNALARSWEREPHGEPWRNPARTEPRPPEITQDRLERANPAFSSGVDHDGEWFPFG